MIRIALPYIYQLSDQLEPLKTLKAGKFNDIAYVLFQADHTLQGLLHDSVFASSIVISRASGEALLQRIRDETGNNDFTREVLWYSLAAISTSYGEFKTVFQAEMANLPAFFVGQKQAYDINVLLKTGEKLFPEELLIKVPEAKFDVREAGRALAFELSTACAFHTFRVLESVLRRYYIQVTNGKAEPKQRNLGVYIRALAGCGSPKILAALSQIKDLHRNPTIHPEAAIANDEAVSILGMAVSAITAMLKEIDVPDLTTLTAIT